ncbi:hypothetical protein DFAR_2690044 [Desulfarculales bacterium]
MAVQDGTEGQAILLAQAPQALCPGASQEAPANGGEVQALPGQVLGGLLVLQGRRFGRQAHGQKAPRRRVQGRKIIRAKAIALAKEAKHTVWAQARHATA